MCAVAEKYGLKLLTYGSFVGTRLWLNTAPQLILHVVRWLSFEPLAQPEFARNVFSFNPSNAISAQGKLQTIK